MTRVSHNNERCDYVCKSTEAKPSDGIADGTTLLEVDTGKIFVCYEGDWYVL